MSHNKKPFYITTTIPYVNDDVHIGNALELIQADVYARYKRKEGFEVFFSTGTDEHGLKIYQKAEESEQTPQEYVDYYAERFRTLVDTFDLSYDNLIRTSDPHHKEAAQDMWRRCSQEGDIYKKNFKGLYCVSDEMFVRESDLVNGECPNHPGKKLIEMEEENYFFKLSKYQDELIEMIESNEHSIVPDFRRNELLTFIKGGLEDVSISRKKESLPWGVPVPDDPDHVMYVWFDALTNYISTLGWGSGDETLFEKFWEIGDTLQLAGKDQLRFQTVLWQAMLRSAKIPTTKKVFYHGFINSGGMKMSKSVGNVIGPFDVVEEYGVDALRYFLLRHIHPFQDSDLTYESMTEYYNANLANGLGNLVSRVVKMAASYDVNVEFPSHESIWNDAEWNTLKDLLEQFEFNQVLDLLWKEIGSLDAYIAETEPYKVVKVDREKAQEIVAYLLMRLNDIAVMLEPFMPETSTKILQALRDREVKESLFERKV